MKRLPLRWMHMALFVIHCKSGHEEPSAPATSTSTSTSAVQPTPATEIEPERKPDVLYVPTPQLIVDQMLRLARVSGDDVVYDLGCGDGRIVVTAAKVYGARALGVDIDPERVAEARENVRRNGLERLVTIEQRDIFELDLTPASVVTLYLLPELNVRLIPQLAAMKAGSRVVSHEFDIEGVTPVSKLALNVEGEALPHQLFFYAVPFLRP